jgi:glutamate/tyrosine decarboxylase-like PLP-dependent enzyme
MRKLLETTAQYAIRYLESLDARNVAPTQEAIANLIQFDEPLPNEPVDPELVLQQLDEVGSPASMAQAGCRFFGFVTGGSLPTALAANWLAAAWDQNCGMYRITPAIAVLEQVALRWLLDVQSSTLH